MKKKSYIQPAVKAQAVFSERIMDLGQSEIHNEYNDEDQLSNQAVIDADEDFGARTKVNVWQ